MSWAEVASYGICLFVVSLLCIGNWPAEVIRAIRGTEPVPENDIEQEDDADDNSQPLQVAVARIHHAAIVPNKKHECDAGYDVYPVEDVVLQPGERKLVPLGLQMAIPDGFYGRLAPRSGHALKAGIDVLAGVIDATYRGEVGVVLLNTGNAPYTITKETAVAQIIIEAHYDSEWVLVGRTDDTERGDGGFGSTDEV